MPRPLYLGATIVRSMDTVCAMLREGQKAVPVPVAGAAAGRLASAMSDALLWAVSLIDRLPLAAVQVGKTDVSWILVALLVVIAVSRLVRIRAWRRPG